MGDAEGEEHVGARVPATLTSFSLRAGEGGDGGGRRWTGSPLGKQALGRPPLDGIATGEAVAGEAAA